MAKLNETPRGERLHIGIFGKTNAGKSTLINAISGFDTALVSQTPGTTTDPVYKSIEMGEAGPAVLIDTPGIEDSSELGKLREGRMNAVADKTDIAVIVIDAQDSDTQPENALIERFKKQETPYIVVANEFNGASSPTFEYDIKTDIKNGNVRALKELIIKTAPKEKEASLTDGLVESGDVVILVMPQDESAPKGRLILPQVRVIRDLLDKNAVPVCVQLQELRTALANLKNKPKLVITDSQVFDKVNDEIDKSIPLTSFSMLLAKEKGDIKTYFEGARAIEKLQDGDRVLIAESCTHHVKKGDIASQKLPDWIRQYTGKNIGFEVAPGAGFPEDLTGYALIIQCGGCMANKRAINSRISKAKKAGVPITNFGVAIAFLKGILERVTI